MKTAELDYDLPVELIAQEPIEPRDQSRLLVLHRDTGEIEHRIFHEIGAYLAPDALLVANESRVIPARLYGFKEPTGGRVEVLLLQKLEELEWRCLVGGARALPGTVIRFYHREETNAGPGSPDLESAPAVHITQLTAVVTDAGERGERTLRFSEPVEGYYEQVGHMPLPPYIHHRLEDPERYQTVYAHTPGSAAAPTAGLHFTPDLLLHLRDQGVKWATVTLHVGLDTFRPITEEQVEAHEIHSEWCELDLRTAEQINRTKVRGKPVVAVGTTSVRVLETAAREGLFQAPVAALSNTPGQGNDAGAGCPWRPVSPFQGFTNLYITPATEGRPGFRFRIVDALITNFHLPRSSLLALVMAFAGEDAIRRAYAVAIRERYRFFSFGDAMLIV